MLLHSKLRGTRVEYCGNFDLPHSALFTKVSQVKSPPLGLKYSKSKVPHSALRRKEEEYGTNLQNKGLISADRGTRATLMLTIPRSLFKSYTKDLLFPIFELVIQHRLKLLLWNHSAATML